MKKLGLIIISSLFWISCSSSAPKGTVGDTPCEDCGKRGDIELKIHSELFYREWNPSAYKKWDSTAVIGVLPTQVVKALAPENCRFCHAFSEDALDFDLARVEDSLFARAFPKMRRELMFPGSRVPEEDSTWLKTWTKQLLKTSWVEGKPLMDSSPWLSMAGVEQSFERLPSDSLKALLVKVAFKYNIRYLSLPILLEVEVLPKAGKSGGYTWKNLWTLWDVRYGELVFLTYVHFVAESKTRVSPERFWAEPFAPHLWHMLKTNPSEIENH